MFWNRSAADIVRVWEAEIAVKQENGAIPLWTVGAPSATLPGLPGLAATVDLATRRQDVTLPLLPVGGSGAAWLGHLLAPQPVPTVEVDAARWPGDPTVVFAGADPVTVHATLAALAADVNAPAQGETIPAHLALELAPRLVPGASVAWEALPFLEMGEQSAYADDPAQVVDGLRSPGASESGAPGTVDWAGWSALLLALSLVLSAVLV